MPLLYAHVGATDQIIRIPDDTANNGTPSTSDVTTWTLPSAINSPTGIAVDSNNNIYVADNDGDQVYRVNLPDGGGNATIAQTINLPSINAPSGLAFDSNDNMYVANTVDTDIYKIALSSLTFTNDVASPAIGDFDRIDTPSDIVSPNGLAIDSSNILYISDTNDDVFNRITLSSLTFTNGVASPSNNDFDEVTMPSAINNPFGITVDDSNNLYVVDYTVDDVFVLLADTADGTTATTQRQWNLPSDALALSLAYFSDITQATLTLSTTDTDRRGGKAFTVDIDSDIDISNFVIGDISVTNGTASNFVMTDARNFSVDITPDSGSGIVTVEIGEDAVSPANAAVSEDFFVCCELSVAYR